MPAVEEKSLPPSHPASLEAIRRRGEAARHEGEPDLSRGIDRSRWFVCPTLTPLYYTHVYGELAEHHQRRYNQLTALSFNELIALFEERFAASVLAAMTVSRTARIDEQLADCLRGFLRDEERHQGYWRRLNELTEPGWYAAAPRSITRLSRLAMRAWQFLAERPQRFTAVFWLMLALEERSLNLSRRTLAMDPQLSEPVYRAIYALHLRDEARHVELDCHLIERFYAPQSRRWRAINARILALLLGRFFLRPSRSAVQVVERLAAEDASLAVLLPRMVRELRQVGRDDGYQQTVYSRAATPRFFALLDRYAEMGVMRSVLRHYQPPRRR